MKNRKIETVLTVAYLVFLGLSLLLYEFFLKRLERQFIANLEENTDAYVAGSLERYGFQIIDVPPAPPAPAAQASAPPTRVPAPAAAPPAAAPVAQAEPVTYQVVEEIAAPYEQVSQGAQPAEIVSNGARPITEGLLDGPLV